jgi:hypothetical protein
VQPVSTRGSGPRRGRQVILLVLLVAAVSLVGALSYGFIWYDQATKPDRSSPDVAVSNYLRAMFVDRDEVRAGLFACRERSVLDEIRRSRDDLVAREKDLHVNISVSWGPLQIARDNGRTSVSVDVRRTALIDGVTQSVVDPWLFEVVQQDGWRVCGAHKVPG